MTLQDAGLLLAALLVPVLVIYGAGHLSRWYAGRVDPVERLIAQNAARWCLDAEGKPMSTYDPKMVERAGERVWQQTLRAQRKTRQPLAPVARVRDFDADASRHRA